MKLKEIISDLNNIDDEAVLYVKRIDDQFSPESETVVLKLTEEELEWKIFEVIEKKCPGYEYFLEVFLIKEIAGDLGPAESVDSKCRRIIYYAEFDA